MPILDELTFVKKAPSVNVAAGHSPMDRAKKKLLADIDTQIALARDPGFVIRKERKKRDGTIEMLERKPKSWTTVAAGDAFITVRFSNKPMPLGGKRGNIIKCAVGDVANTLTKVRGLVAAGEVDDVIERLMKEAKRRSRKS